MSLVGPNGQPLVGGTIVGAPKTLEDISAYEQKDIDAFIEGARGLMAQGAPPEVPAAMPMGQIFQLARTLQLYIERAESLERQIVEMKAPEAEEPAPRIDLSAFMGPAK